MESINQLLAGDAKIAVLTGAGVSVPSGIPPFRGKNGLYQNDDVEHLLSIDYLNHEPKAFWKFYRSLFKTDQLLAAQPNPVHFWLHDLERDHEVTIVTQNIDGLHRKAGSRHVIEIHGAFIRTICPKCGTVYQTAALREQEVPHCTAQSPRGSCHAVLKPDIVLFGEAVPGFEAANRAICQANRLIILGTSLGVAPANILPLQAKMAGVPTLLINDRSALQMDCIDRFVRVDFSHFDPNREIS